MSAKRLSAVTTGIQPHVVIVFTTERESFHYHSFINGHSVGCVGCGVTTHAKRVWRGAGAGAYVRVRVRVCNNA